MRTSASDFPPAIAWSKRTKEPADAMIQTHHDVNQAAVKYHPPSAITSWVETAPLESSISHVAASSGKIAYLERSSTIHEIHLSAGLMDEFMVLASANTENDLETCGVLGASLKNGTFYVTTLIVPKQESSSNSCLALREEEIFALQDELSLFPLGWIHTHPSQSCFMSSIDLHTQYSFQVMLPEAVAIVMAPTDSSRNFGIFRLTDPAGINALRDCKERGFHLHREPTDGSPIYEDCSNVFINPNLRFEIIDLR
ncbi:associated molecule with the SH3 domain of STAM 2 isoform X2 [Wolffia australiana]